MDCQGLSYKERWQCVALTERLYQNCVWKKKKRTAKLSSAKFMLHALLEEISANEDKARKFTQKRPVCSAGPARYANGFPFGGAGYTADGEGYPLKMGALRAGNA